MLFLLSREILKQLIVISVKNMLFIIIEKTFQLKTSGILNQKSRKPSQGGAGTEYFEN